MPPGALYGIRAHTKGLVFGLARKGWIAMRGDEAMRVALVGLPEAVRARVVAEYRGAGGTMTRPDVPALRGALRVVRRQGEDAGRPWAGDLTRREDLLE